MPIHCILEAHKLSDFIGSWLEQNFALGWIVSLVSLIPDLDDITATFDLELILEWVKTLGAVGIG